MMRKALHIAVTILAPIAVSTHADAKPRPVKPTDTDAVARGDATAGSQVFKTSCAVCHGKQAEGTKLAPPLLGVVGSRAASSPFPGYTAALRASGVIWSPTKLDAFLPAPAKLIPGTAMTVSVPRAEDRQNLIAYLASVKK